MARISSALQLLGAAEVEVPAVEADALAMAVAFTDDDDSVAPAENDWDLFVGESLQHLDSCETELRELGGDASSDAAAVQRGFRALHTFKGNCGLVGAGRLELLARAGEDVLSGLRSGELAPTAPLRAALLQLFAALRDGLATPSEDGERARVGLVQAAEQARRVAAETRLGDLLVAKQLVDPLDVQAALAWKARPLGEVLVDLHAITPDALEDALGEQRRLREGGQAVARASPTMVAA